VLVKVTGARGSTMIVSVSSSDRKALGIKNVRSYFRIGQNDKSGPQSGQVIR
jgi:hypothetical protein